MSSDKDPTGGSQLTKEMLSGFHRCCKHIKQTFDDARKIKVTITRISLASFLWDVGKQDSPRCDTTECVVPSGAILFAKRCFIKNLYDKLKSLLMPLKMKVALPK